MSKGGMERCQIPGCERPQEFQTEEARCINHSLEWWYYWTPLAEFGPIPDTEPGTNRSGGDE